MNVLRCVRSVNTINTLIHETVVFMGVLKCQQLQEILNLVLITPVMEKCSFAFKGNECGHSS